MEITSEWLSRKLGYGFSFDEELPSPDKWIEKARDQVASVPKFDPWRLIAKNPEAKKLEDLDLPQLPFMNSVSLKKSDIRYPKSIDSAVSLYKQGDNEKSKLEKLYKAKKITEGELTRNYFNKYNRFPWWRDTVTRGIDNVLGTSPVFNRFWHFWINHFSLNTGNCEGELFGSYYLTLRSNLDAKFENLLFDAIWHPAMQVFLNNNESVGPNSKSALYNKSIGKKKINSINENLAREILELYTVTPKANFTQNDVNSAAYILSGWGAFDWNGRSAKYFSLDKAEPGTHIVLGKKYGGEDLESGLKNLCRELSKNPLTAHHIANKLAVHFISDDPPEESVRRISDAFTKSNGSLVKVHQAVIGEVVSAGPSFKKFSAPELWFWQAHRASKFFPPLFTSDFSGINFIDDMLTELGQLHSKAPQPNGWPDLDRDWITPEYLERRIRYANRLAWNLSRDEKFDPKAYVERLPGADEETSNSVRRSESYKTACNILFCSHQFLEV